MTTWIKPIVCKLLDKQASIRWVTTPQHVSGNLFCNAILFAISTSTFSKLFKKKVYSGT
jgi:hypothetical protein